MTKRSACVQVFEEMEDSLRVGPGEQLDVEGSLASDSTSSSQVPSGKIKSVCLNNVKNIPGIHSQSVKLFSRAFTIIDWSRLRISSPHLIGS